MNNKDKSQKIVSAFFSGVADNDGIIRDVKSDDDLNDFYSGLNETQEAGISFDWLGNLVDISSGASIATADIEGLGLVVVDSQLSYSFDDSEELAQYLEHLMDRKDFIIKKFNS